MLMKGGDPLFSSCSDKEKMPVNSVFKYGLVFLGGLVVGALGATAAKRGSLNLKPLATDLISRGMDVKDALMSKMEAVKEDMQDLAAEARAKAEDRKAAPQQDA